MTTEWGLNTILAEYLRNGLARVIGMPETRIKLRKIKGTKQPDIQIVDMLGVRIVVQGKIEHLDEAVEDCKNSIDQGLADICFAAAYPKYLTEIDDIIEIRKELETKAKMEIALVKPPTQLTLVGWPSDSVRKFGALTASELLNMLQGGDIYDEIVGEETAERVATQVEQALDTVKQLPKPSIESIQNRLTELLGIALKEEGGNKDESEETE